MGAALAAVEWVRAHYCAAAVETDEQVDFVRGYDGGAAMRGLS